MKKTSTIILLFFSIICTQHLQIQAAYGQSDKIDYYVDVGAGIPVNPSNFTQNWNIGYGAGVGVSYEVQPNVKLQLYGQYYRFGFDEEGARDNVNVSQTITGIDGVEANMYSMMLNAIYEYKLPGISTSTYFSVGAGYFRVVRSDFTVTTSDDTFNIDQNSGSSLGVNGAVGIRRALSRNLSMYVEAKFVTGLFVDNRTQYLPLSVGIIF